MSFNPNVSYGRALMDAVHAQIPVLGRVFIVVDSDDAGEEKYDRVKEVFKTDTNGKVRVYTDLKSAYDATTSNNNDVIVLDGDGTHTVTPFTWSKNRVHLVGFDGGGRLAQQGSKVANSTSDTDAYVIKVTGTRNTFRNIKFIQNSTNAAALNVVQCAGEGSVYENCSFIFGVSDNLDQTDAYEVLMGEDAGTFRKCSFGTDVLLTSAARAVMALDNITGASSADGAKSNYFEDCEYVIMSSSASAVAIKLVDTAGAKFLNRWVRPRFHAVLNDTNSAAAITNAIQSASNFIEGSLHFYLPASFDCTNLCAGTTDNVVTYAPATAAAGGEGGTPT